MVVATFTAVFAVLAVAHLVMDFWGQPSAWALAKSLPSWVGRAACMKHVSAHAVASAGLLAVMSWRLELGLDGARVVAGLVVIAGSHYFADRRVPLQRLAGAAGLGGLWELGVAPFGGAFWLDQSWHAGWLLVGAGVVAG